MDEQAAFDGAIDQYERAVAARAAGDDETALAAVEAALAMIESLADTDAAIARARFAITRADLATRTKPTDEAIAIASDAVARARRVAKREPTVEASALYMQGKAERGSQARRHGAASFERSLTLWRKHAGDDTHYAADAAASLGAACVKMAEWQRAMNALDFLSSNAPDGLQPIHYLHRAIAGERLGEIDKAQLDIERWFAGGADRSIEDRIRGHLCASRILASRGDPARSRHELGLANGLVRELPSDHVMHASLFEATAWFVAIATIPSWPLASEVLMRRAAAIAWSPILADTASKIAALWRPGVEEVLVQPTFAALEVEACLVTWNPDALVYAPKEGRHQQMHLVVAGAPTTIERLADDRWRELCVQRIFSTFHAEQFDSRERNFVSPVRSIARRLGAEQVLALLPSLRIPAWATTKTIALNSVGEIEVASEAELAALAIRATTFADEAASDAMIRAVPGLEPSVARSLLTDPPESLIMPPAAIPLLPTT